MDDVTMIQGGAVCSFVLSSITYWAARAAADGWFARKERVGVRVQVTPTRRARALRRAARASARHAIASADAPVRRVASARR